MQLDLCGEMIMLIVFISFYRTHTIPIFLTVDIVFKVPLNWSIAFKTFPRSIGWPFSVIFNCTDCKLCLFFVWFFFLKRGLTATSEEPPHQSDAWQFSTFILWCLKEIASSYSSVIFWFQDPIPPFHPHQACFHSSSLSLQPYALVVLISSVSLWWTEPS